MVDEVLRSGGSASSAGNSEVSAFGCMAAPWGFAARYSPADSPADLSGSWVEFVPLDCGRTGLLLGCCRNSAALAAVRSAARATLLETTDPIQTLSMLTPSNSSAVCAVIDGDTIGYGGMGHACGVISTPGGAPTLLAFEDDRLVAAPLEPGATVLFFTGPLPTPAAPAGLLDDCAGMHPGPLADRVIRDLAGRDHQSSAAVLYRQPPEPLRITLPAEPGSLSVSRGQLRTWLNQAGLDSETCADVLLAAGEATANATEHAVVGAPGQVHITLDAGFDTGTLRLSVSDNGRWKPATGSQGHRGHGLHLMKALMNLVELKTDPQGGTTVTMVKELLR